MSEFLWDDFRLVRAVAQARSLSGAAGVLGVNPSTVFRRLGEVEERLGAKLFERHRTGYALTPAGEEMAGLADRFDEQVSAFRIRLAGQHVKPSGDLRVTMSESLLADLVTPVLAGFRRSCADIRLDVVVTNQSLNLSKRDADVAIRATDQPPENLVGRRVAQLAWAIYAPRPTNGDETPSVTEAIHHWPWVAFGENFQQLQTAKFVREHVAPDRIVYRLNSVLGLTEAVENGVGVGPLPCFIADARPGVVRISPVQLKFSSGLWLLTHPELRQSPRVRVFMDFAADALGKLKPLIEGQRPIDPVETTSPLMAG